MYKNIEQALGANNKKLAKDLWNNFLATGGYQIDYSKLFKEVILLFNNHEMYRESLDTLDLIPKHLWNDEFELHRLCAASKLKSGSYLIGDSVEQFDDHWLCYHKHTESSSDFWTGPTNTCLTCTLTDHATNLKKPTKMNGVYMKNHYYGRYAK